LHTLQLLLEIKADNKEIVKMISIKKIAYNNLKNS